MTATYDVVGLGTVLVDHQAVVPNYPKADTKIEIVRHRRQVGGPVPTALAMLTRLGRTCSFIGKWSDDEAGQFIRHDLSDAQIDTSQSIVGGGSTGFAHVWIDQQTATRTVAAWRGDFAPIASDEIPNPFPSCQVLHLDGWASEAAIAATHSLKSDTRLPARDRPQVFLDTGSPKLGIDSLIPLVDVLSCPERFLNQFRPLKSATDERAAAQQLLGWGPKIVIITKGDRGAVAYTDDKKVTQPAFPVAPVDTTGAGDVFCGALIHGLIENWPLAKMLEFAAATAALKCTAMGNRAALPSMDQINEMMATDGMAGI